MNEKRLKAAAGQAVSYRNYRRARDRALTKLATAHFEQYKELLEKEKAFDEQMGKKWLDINGTTAASLVDTRSDSSSAPIIKERTQATMGEKRENRQTAIKFSKALGYTPRERACLVTLWTRESRFDHLAKNQRGSSAYGIAQLLRERSGDPELQILHGLRYIEHRYRGSACRALRHHARGWY